MQGIISAAMCLQLSRLGLKNTLDAVYGASAGAINGAYFIAGQVRGVQIISYDSFTANSTAQRGYIRRKHSFHSREKQPSLMILGGSFLAEQPDRGGGRGDQGKGRREIAAASEQGGKLCKQVASPREQ